MNNKLLSLALLCASLQAPSVCGAEPSLVVSALRAGLDGDGETVKTLSEKALPDLTKKDSPNFIIKGDRDISLSLGGVLRTEYVRQYRTELMNKECNFDQYGAYNGRIEFDTNVAYGAEKYGRPVIEVGNRMRQKYQAGRFDKAVSLGAASIKQNDVVFDAPARGVNAPVQWAKHLWAKADLNAIFGRNCECTHSLKTGLFDFQLGRGIVYGPFYGTQKTYMGVFTASNDFAPFGLNLSGELIKDRWSYDLYFARFEEKSSDFKQTSARTKAHIVGNRNSGVAGAEKSNDVLAARSMLTFDFKRLGELKSELYLMHNKADDQRVEMINDSLSRLTSLGLGLEYKKGKFEFGAEAALNMGHEQLYNIDRNGIKFTDTYTNDEQSMVRTYSHVNFSLAGGPGEYDGKKALVTAASKEVVDAYEGNTNGVLLSNDPIEMLGTDDTFKLKNASNRYRPAYRNDYRGWMAVADGQYSWDAANLKIAGALGHASGDNNPHESEVDKKYYGFLGLNENYGGGRVNSVLVLNARKIQRPLTIDAGNKVTIDNSFTDMSFVGTGVTWNVVKHDLQVRSNVLSYWKDKPAFAYVYNKTTKTGYLDQSREARSHLGLEANLQFEWKLLPGLNLAADFAIFFPGVHYKDREGMPLDGSIVEGMDAYDPTGYGQDVPRLGTDPVLHMNVGVQYKF